MKFYWFGKRFLSIFVIISLLILVVPIDGDCQISVRNEIKIPNILGYHTLKCDFHMHTVFSDGRVWPTIRPDEVWREGLDAFAITEHIESHRYRDDVKTNLNRSYELAKPGAESLEIIFIKGAEITRKMPPGHINAIFLNDINQLKTEEYKDAVKAAVDQGAFVFWNHPGWTGQQPEGKAIWYSEHTELYENGWMHGIEIVNQYDYYPRAHQWCLDKKLTMMANSDSHNPINFEYNLQNGEHRAMTLVFARERTAEAIKEALFDRRTVVYYKNMLIGEEKYLREIFNESVEVIDTDITIKGKSVVSIQIRNRSDINFELETDKEGTDVLTPKKTTLYAGKTVLLGIRGKSGELSGRKRVHIPCRIKNLLIAPDEGLPVEFEIDVMFIPTEKK